MAGPRDTIRRRIDFMRSRAFFNEVNAALYEGADKVRAHAHHLISRGSVSGKNHVPSAPGESPNRDSGNLQSHLEASQPKPLVARVTSSADYAAPLEWGTSKMAARPYMRPARDAVKPEAERILNKRINRARRQHGKSRN